MNVKNSLAGALVIAGLAVGGPALAQMKDSGWYIGGGVGQSKVDIDTTGMNADVLSVPGITGAATTADETDTGWKIFAGYQINRNFAAELSYANLGKFSTLTTTTPAATFNGTIKIENAWSADVLGILPLGNNFSVFGRVGLLYSETKVSLTGVGPGGTATFSSKDDEFSYKAGLGVGYDFTNNVGLRGEWERYRVSDGDGGKDDVDLFSISLRFRF